MVMTCIIETGDLSRYTRVSQVYLESIRQFLEGRPEEVGEAVFDKEDDLAVEFVTAASNLRAAAYGISQQSLFDAKVIEQVLNCIPRPCVAASLPDGTLLLQGPVPFK